MSGTVDVTNLRADAIATIARLGGSEDDTRQFFHPGWKTGAAQATAGYIYENLVATIHGPDDDDSGIDILSALWRLVHSPVDWYCLRCMHRATQPPGMGHVTVADIGEVCADDLCVECLNRPEPERTPMRVVRLGEAS